MENNIENKTVYDPEYQESGFPKTLNDLLETVVAKYEDRPFVGKAFEQPYTFGDFFDKVRRISEILSEKGIVKGEGIDRQINMRVAAIVKQYPGYKVLWTNTISQNYQDHIPYSSVEKVQNVSYKFAKASVPRKLGKREWFDIGLVGGITGIVIYAFYAFRSK